jgi:dienelactone hydrolase
MKHLGKFIFVFLWLTLCMPLVLVGTVAAQSQFEVVHFSAKARPGVQQANLSDGQPSGTPIWGHISRPSGPGPHPAIVLLHGCGGILQSHFDWAVHLNRSGYATLIVDSFRPRSLISDCSGGSGTASPSGRVLDAYGALDYLMSLDDIDTGKISLIGWSHGGVTALDATNANGLGSRFDKSFQLVVAIYPHCIPDRTFNLPVMILIGERDDWASAAQCRKLEAHNREKEKKLNLVVYPNAFHSFDKPSVGSGFFIPGAPGRKHWLQYDSEAHSDAKERLLSFLEENL